MKGVYPRDENHVPVTNNGFFSTKTISLSASNTTVSVPLFNITGSVQVLALYGIVQSTLSSNVTTTFWQLNDGTATPDITSSTGFTLSDFTTGSIFARTGIVSDTLYGVSASASNVIDPISSGAPGVFMPFVVTQKDGVTTALEFSYTTTNTPASGSIQFFMGWLPLSEGANVTNV